MTINGTTLVYGILKEDTTLFGNIRMLLNLPVTAGPTIRDATYAEQCQELKEIVVDEFAVECEVTEKAQKAIDTVLDSVEWDFLLDLVLEGD